MKINKTSLTALATAAIMTVSSMANAATDQEKQYLKTFGQYIAQQANIDMLALDNEELAAFVEGITACVKGEKLPANMNEIGPKMAEYLEKKAMPAMEKAQQAMQKEQAEYEAKIAAFWKELENDKAVSKTASGLGYKIIKEGDKRLPKEESFVVVKYKGALIDGTVFDQTKEGDTAKFPLNGVIPGFKEGLQKIGKGGIIKLYIPAQLGYGSQQIPGIPAGSTLVFDVEMVDVADAPVPEGMPKGMDINELKKDTKK